MPFSSFNNKSILHQSQLHSLYLSRRRIYDCLLLYKQTCNQTKYKQGSKQESHNPTGNQTRYKHRWA